MVASQSWQGRQSLQVRPRLSLQIAAPAPRPSRIRSTSGTNTLPASLHREVLFACKTLSRFTAALVTHRLCSHQKFAFGCALDRSTSRRCKGQQPFELADERLTSLRCSSGENVSTSDSQSEPDETKHAHERNTSWTRMVLALPLELAAVNSRTDNFYLRKRKRKHWWSVGHFPKVQLFKCTGHAATVQSHPLPTLLTMLSG